MQICVSEGQQVKKGTTLFVIDSRNAQLELEAAQANLKVSQLTEEDLLNRYVQTVINAGNQVNEALADCQAAQEKDVYYKRQVEVLQEAYMGTHELMDNGKANYLEVLSAQEGLLSAQISEATNLYNGARALIALYIALGGGAK